jgi:hypothetical protein
MSLDHSVLTRITGVVYVAYFVLAIAGMALGSTPLSVVGTGMYFVVAIFLYWTFAPADPRIALALLPLAALGCVIQGIGMIQADRDMRRLALLFFGLFLVVLGYLIARSTLAPPPLGYALAIAGVSWCAIMIPGVSAPLSLGVMALGGAAEIVLALWLLLAG